MPAQPHGIFHSFGHRIFQRCPYFRRQRSILRILGGRTLQGFFLSSTFQPLSRSLHITLSKLIQAMRRIRIMRQLCHSYRSVARMLTMTRLCPLRHNTVRRHRTVRHTTGNTSVALTIYGHESAGRNVYSIRLNHGLNTVHQSIIKRVSRARQPLLTTITRRQIPPSPVYLTQDSRHEIQDNKHSHVSIMPASKYADGNTISSTVAMRHIYFTLEQTRSLFTPFPPRHTDQTMEHARRTTIPRQITLLTSKRRGGTGADPVGRRHLSLMVLIQVQDRLRITTSRVHTNGFTGRSPHYSYVIIIPDYGLTKNFYQI